MRKEESNIYSIGALIPIRLSSSRLPGKAIKPILGRPAVHHLLDRCFASRYLSPESVIVCTTNSVEDDALVSLVESTGARIYRGNRDDLVDRLYQAMKANSFDLILQVDGDDICADTYYMDLCIKRLLSDDRLDVVYGDGLPLGISTKVVRGSAFKKVFEAYKPGKNDTGFMYYFTRSGIFNVGVVQPVSPKHTHKSLRLTLDYKEDMVFFRAIFEILYRPGKIFGVEEIVTLVNKRPELLEINTGLDEKYMQRTRDLVEEAALEIQTANGVKYITI